MYNEIHVNVLINLNLPEIPGTNQLRLMSRVGKVLELICLLRFVKTGMHRVFFDDRSDCLSDMHILTAACLFPRHNTLTSAS